MNSSDFKVYSQIYIDNTQIYLYRKILRVLKIDNSLLTIENKYVTLNSFELNVSSLSDIIISNL
jgi:HKD family nuclease